MDNRVEIVARIYEATEYVKSRIDGFVPEVGIVLGSGLGVLAEHIKADYVIPYTDIPNFAKSTAMGHKGNFIFGTLAGKRVCAMQGRFHYYEGYPMSQLTLPIRVMKLIGIRYLFVSNAAGGVNFDYKVGDLMIIKDHINHLPNPLIGQNLDVFGVRFPDMTRPYDPRLRAIAKEVASSLGIAVHEGVYIAGTGPSFETPAEYKYFRLIGADAVGMSTIPEVIVARHMNIPVFGMSVISNEAHDDYAEDFVNDGNDVIVAANLATAKMSSIFEGILQRL